VVTMDEINKIINIIAHSPFDVLVIALLIYIGFLIFKKLFVKYICTYCCKFIKKTENTLDDKIFESLEKPLKFLIDILGLYFSLKYLALSIYKEELTLITEKVLRCGLVIFFTWIIYNVTMEDSLLYNRIKNKYTDKVNKIIFPFISIIIRILALIAAVSIFSREFGFSGFVTGLGVSGVVIALAAQETFSNLFGGMVILFDRPFSIGDWIQTSDVEGIVKEITFRSTKIRTFSKALVTVPNSKLANSYIINWTDRKKRRILFKLPLDYGTRSKKIKILVKEIEDFLLNDERVDKELVIVSFNAFSEHSLDVSIYFYTNVMEYLAYEKTKEDINLTILEILEKNEVSLAIPWSRVELYKNEEAENGK